MLVLQEELDFVCRKEASEVVLQGNPRQGEAQPSTAFLAAPHPRYHAASYQLLLCCLAYIHMLGQASAVSEA